MNLITKRERYATLAERFADAVDIKSAYYRNVYKKLVRLGDDPDQAAADALIERVKHHGNVSQLLAVPKCTLCDTRRDQVVAVATKYLPVQTFYLCGDCLIKALNLTEENC